MRLFLYILLLCLTIWAGWFLYYHPGNIELAYGEWLIDMPLWVPVISGIFIILVLSLISSLFASIFRGYRRVKEWISGSTWRAMTKNANAGYVALAEGDWDRCEALMLKAAKHCENPVHYYLAAAIAVQEVGALDRRDNYLHAALRSDPEAKVAVYLTQASLQYKQGQYENCLATLQEVYRWAPHNAKALRLHVKVLEATGQWQEMIELLPQIKKHAELPVEDYAALEIKSYNYILRLEARKSAVKNGLIACWDQIPRNVRHNPEVVQCYAQLLLNIHANEEAEEALRSALKRQWDSRLIQLYGIALGADIGKQVHQAEVWLKSHPTDPDLLLSLARLCVAFKLWGKAKSYLEESIAITPTPDAYAELGRLLGFLGEQQKSLECYKKGLLEFASVLQVEHASK